MVYGVGGEGGSCNAGAVNFSPDCISRTSTFSLLAAIACFVPLVKVALIPGRTFFFIAPEV